MSALEGGEKQPEPGRPRLPRPSLAQTAALVGLIGGIVGLVFLFKPGWKPAPRADVGKLTIRENSIRASPGTLRRFYQRVRLPPLDLSPTLLRQRGVLVEFSFEANGFRSETLKISRELIDAATNEPVAENTSQAFRYSDDSVGIELSTNNEARKWFVWSPVPRTRRRYYVTVSIYQPRKGDVDVPLDDFNSPEFRGLAAN